jgi:NTE family protein
VTARVRGSDWCSAAAAQGCAHVGVLSVLEELRVPIDCIVGTSMGALVGGTYASGLTAAEVDTAVRGISFQETIGFEGERKHQSMRRKLAGDIYSNRFEFGVHEDGLTAPSGFINTQNIEQTIALPVSRSLGVRD